MSLQLCSRRRSFSLDIFTALEGTGGNGDSEHSKDKEVILPHWALINLGIKPPLVLTVSLLPHMHRQHYYNFSILMLPY